MPLRNGTKNVNAALRPVSLPGRAKDASSPVFNLTPVPMPAGQRNQPRQAATPADDLAPITTKYATPPPKPRPVVSHVFKSPEELKAAYRPKTQEELKHGFGKDAETTELWRAKPQSGAHTDEERRKYTLADWKRAQKQSAENAAWAKDALSRAMDAEVHGQRLTALKNYRAAATDARAKGDAAKLQLATDGIAQCQAPVVPTWQHPGYGKSKAYDTAEHALEAAVLRTRAGERVRVLDSKVVPARDGDDDTVGDHPDAVYKKPQPWQDVRKGKDAEAFKQGDKVTTDVTPQTGVVLSVEGSGDNAKVLVQFGKPDKYGVADVRKLYAYLLRKEGRASDLRPIPVPA